MDADFSLRPGQDFGQITRAGAAIPPYDGGLIHASGNHV
jgi:hypothetical protein